MVKKVAGKYTEADYFQFRQADPNFTIIFPQEQDLPITIDRNTGTFYCVTKNSIRSAVSHKCLLLRSFLYEDLIIETCVKGAYYFQDCLYAWTESEFLLVKEGKVVERKELSVKEFKQGFLLLEDGTLKKNDSVISKDVRNFDSNGSSYAFISGNSIKTESMEWNVPEITSLCVINEETVIVGSSSQVHLLSKDEMIEFGDPTNAYSGPDARYLFKLLPGWGVNQPIHQLIVVAHTLSADLALIAKLNDGTWTILNPSADDALAQLPFTRGTGSDDQSPRQLLVDFSDSMPSPSPLPDGVPLPPSPILWVVTNEGTLCPFRLVNSACEQLHPLMQHPIEKEYSTKEIEKMKQLVIEQKKLYEEFQSFSPSSSFEVIINPENEDKNSKLDIHESAQKEQELDIEKPEISITKGDHQKVEQPVKKKHSVAEILPIITAPILKVEGKPTPRRIQVDLECQVRKEYAGYENNLSQLFCQLYLNIQKDLESSYRKLEDLEAITERGRQDFITDFQKNALSALEVQRQELKGLKGECAAALVAIKRKGFGEAEETAFNELESVVKDANLYASLGGKCTLIVSLYQSAIRERVKRFSQLICTEQDIAASITPRSTNTIMKAKDQVPLRRLLGRNIPPPLDTKDESSISSPPTSFTIGFSPVSETTVSLTPIPMTTLPPVKVATETKSFKVELETMIDKPFSVPSPLPSATIKLSSTVSAPLAISPISNTTIPLEVAVAKSTTLEEKKVAFDISELSFGSSSNSTLAKEEEEKEASKKSLEKEASNMPKLNSPKLSFSPVLTAEKEETKTAFTQVITEKDSKTTALDFTNLSFGIQTTEEPKTSSDSSTKTSFTSFGAFRFAKENPKKDTPVSLTIPADNKTSFGPFGAIPSKSAFGAKAASLFSSELPPPQSTSTSTTSNSGFGLAFGQTSLPSNPFLKPPITEATQPAIFTGFNNPSVDFAALANNNEPKKEDEKKNLPPSFTQFRG